MPPANTANTAEPGPAPPAGSAAPPPRRASDGAAVPVIPDCCNLGIAARILASLNFGAVLIAMLSAQSLDEALRQMALLCGSVNPLALLSLIALCAVRRAVIGRNTRRQWLLGLAVPLGITLIAGVLAAPFLVPDHGPRALLAWLLVRGLVAVAITALCFEFFRLRTLSFAPSLTEARLQALQARIRPHFLFNSLNTVLGLMRGDPRRAEHTLENLADLFRVFMRDNRELVPLDEEVVVCQQYVAIEELRLGDRLKVQWHLQDMPSDALLPSLLLQPLIENAVHHGIEPSTEPGEISVSVGKVGERIRVEILNTMTDRPPVRTGNRMALSNVRERLMLLYDMEAELKTEAVDGRFRVLLEFPYRKERRRRDARRHFSPYR